MASRSDDDDGDRREPRASRRRRDDPSSSSSSGSSTSGSSDSDSSSDSGSESPPRNRRGGKDGGEPLAAKDSPAREVDKKQPEPGPARQSEGADAEKPKSAEGIEQPDQARRSVFDRIGKGSGPDAGGGRDADERRRPADRDRDGGCEQDRRRDDADRDDPDRHRYDSRRDRDGGDYGRERYRSGDDDRYGNDRYDSRRDRRGGAGGERDDDYHGRRERGGAGDRWRGDWDEQEASRGRDYGRDRDRGRDTDRGRQGERDRDRDGDRDRWRDRGRDRERDRARESERDRERGREREPDRRDRDDSPRKRRRGDDDADAAREQPRRGEGATARGDGAAADAGAAAAGPEAAGNGPAAATVTEEPVARKPVTLGKTGGVYIPPFKLARMMAEQGAQDKSSPEYQRLTWEALKKSLNGVINKVNTVNLKNILPEVFRENLIRGRGLLCRSLMKSQAASPSFTPVYAALVAVANTKFPEMGELLLSRLILQFKRSFKRNDKPVCTAASKFIAHLVNQGVAHEVLALEVLILLLEVPSEDSVEMAVEFVREVGAHLQDVAPQGLHGVFERFRAILHEGSISKRVQFIIEGLFALRKAGFEASGFPALKPELDLVEAEDQITHELGLDDQLQAQTNLDVFRVDPNYEEEERKYAAIAREILGEEEEEGEEEEAGAGSEQADEEGTDGDDEEEGEPGSGGGGGGGTSGGGGIHDETATNLVNLRRTIYLTLMSSFDFEEAGHKLLKIGIQPGQEIELVTMIIECCSQERTFKRFYGLLAQRFCYLNRAYAETFEDCFRKQYSVIHRLETNKLRNVSCLFAHLLATDALPWSALVAVRLTEEDTTSSSRIFIKYLFQELSSTMGLVKLNQRLNDPAFSPWFEGLFPRDSLQHMRFSINFFTSIGLGGVTDTMRETYKNTVAAQAAVQQQQVARRMLGSGSGSDSSGSSGSDSGSSSSSGSDSDSSDSSSSSSSSGSDSDSDDSRGRRRRGKGKGKEKAKKKKKGGGNSGGGGSKGRKSKDSRRRS